MFCELEEIVGFEIACQIEDIIDRHFAQLYEEVLKEVSEHLVRIVSEKYPEEWQEAIRLKETGEANDELYEALCMILW